MRRSLCALLIITIFLLAACKNVASPPALVTDGINCIVTAQGDEGTKRLRISRSGVSYEALFIHSDGTKGLGLTISPGGCQLDVYGVKKQIDITLVSHSLPVLIYAALNHDYSTDEYANGCYKCSDSCGEFAVWADEKGIISSINFTDYNYNLAFDYKTA